MRFELNDVVLCDERPGHRGRVLRVRRGVGLIQVQWSQHLVSWHDDEALTKVESSVSRQENSAVSTAVLGHPDVISANTNNMPTCEVLFGGQTGSTRGHQTISAARERMTVSADGRR